MMMMMRLCTHDVTWLNAYTTVNNVTGLENLVVLWRGLELHSVLSWHFVYCIVTGSCRPFQRSAQLHCELRATSVGRKYRNSLSEQSFYCCASCFLFSTTKTTYLCTSVYAAEVMRWCLRTSHRHSPHLLTCRCSRESFLPATKRLRCYRCWRNPD